MSAVVLVGGGTCSGKSTLVEKLVEAGEPGEVVRIPMDAYYRDLSAEGPEVRAAHNYDEPAAIEMERLVADMKRLVAGETIARPSYDFATHSRTANAVEVPPAPILVVEGLFALRDRELLRMAGLALYVAADDDLRLARRVARDGERGRTIEMTIRQYTKSVRAMHTQWVQPTKAHADLIVPGIGDFKRIAPLLLAAARALDPAA